MTRAARAYLRSLLVASLAACANGGGAPGPVSARPAGVEGETLRGPEPGAEVVEAVVEPVPRGADRLDWNGDRHVDREEFRNFFTRAFHQVDGDDDRLLRGDELASLPADAMQADRNGDGALDVEEYVDLALVWFARCDRNADDVLGADEERACAEDGTRPR